MTKVISINDFKNKKDNNDVEKLTKAGKSFRERFVNSIKALQEQFDDELEKANSISDVKTKINISTVVKHAKASPLAAYSDHHKEFVANLIENAINECNKSLEDKFTGSKKPTIESLQKQLIEERAIYKAELSKISSQKMTEYISLTTTKNT